jgi:predicted CxxxxCH...CXXCH cytochrome family protein
MEVPMTARLCVLAALVACDLGHHDVLDSGPANTEASTSCAGACHGEGGTAAPPRDTSGRSDTASIGVGAHRQHLQGSTWHKNFECATCHKVPVEVGDVGHIFDAQGNRLPLPAAVIFTGMGAGASWDHDTATCTSSYCHGDTLHQVDQNTGAIVGGAGGSITQPVWTKVDGSQSQCGTCHGNPPPMPHPQNPDCGLCHQTMNPGQPTIIAYPQLHIDGIVQVASTQPCDSCHGSNGQSAPPRDAHGNTATTAPGVGAHAQHMTANSPWHAPIACNECHLVPGSTTDLTHIDQVDEVFMDPTVALPGGQSTGGHLGIKGASWNASALTCSGTYCHGGGTSPLTGGATTSPKWTQVDGSQSKCQSCHGMPPPSPHPQDSDCGKCHPTMTAGGNNQVITYPAKHIDGNVDVINDQPCNYCHGDPNANPIAGDNFINAPPNDTMGQMSTDLRSVGAHQSHMKPSTWRAPVTCDQCHTVPTSVLSIGHIDHPLPAYVIFGNLAGSTATWNGSTCSNVYCHGATLNDGGNPAGGTTTKPIWTVVDGSQSQCGSCHGLPPPAPHPQDADCGKCHNTMTAGGGLVITDPSRHIDGNLDVNTDQPCNNCHGSAGTPTSNSAAINAPPKDSAGNTATTARGVGAHQSHLNPANLFFKAVLCQDCHTVPATVNSVGHIDHPLPAYVKFSSRAGSTPAWNGAICSNVYCHGATLTDGSTGAGGAATTPQWNKVDGSQAKCTSCHGNPPPAPHPQDPNCQNCHTDMSSPTTFSDPTRHIDGNLDVNANQACNSCHGNHTGTPATNSDPANAPPFDSTGTGSATTLRGVGAHASHLKVGTNWHADVTCAECHTVPATVNSVGHMDHLLPATMMFTGIAAGTAWNGANCSSYCHGTTLLAGGSATNPNWTKVDGTQSTCTSCHGNPPPSPHPQDSNCQNCHNDMSSPTTFSAPQNHINGTVEVTMVHPAGYNAREQHGYDFDKMGPSTCATASCHGTALTGGNTGGPSCENCHSGWQTQCTFCHGGTDNTTGAPPQGVLGATAATDPTVGAHSIHVNQTTRHAAWDCNYCHTKPSSALTPGHVDGTGGVVQAEVVFSSFNPAGTFTTATYTCSNMYCHGTGVSGATGPAPAWTSTATLACVDGCHGGSPNYTNMSSEHRNSSHKKPCATCHMTVVDANLNIINLGLHVNGTRDVQFQNAGSSYNAAAKSCTNTGNGCHGTGTKSSW